MPSETLLLCPDCLWHDIQIWTHCARWDLRSAGWSGISSSYTVCLLTPPTRRFTFLKTPTYYWLAQFVVHQNPSSFSSVLLSQHLLCNLILCIWFLCVILPTCLKIIPSHWVQIISPAHRDHSFSDYVLQIHYSSFPDWRLLHMKCFPSSTLIMKTVNRNSPKEKIPL